MKLIFSGFPHNEMKDQYAGQSGCNISQPKCKELPYSEVYYRTKQEIKKSGQYHNKFNL